MRLKQVQLYQYSVRLPHAESSQPPQGRVGRWKPNYS